MYVYRTEVGLNASSVESMGVSRAASRATSSAPPRVRRGENGSVPTGKKKALRDEQRLVFFLNALFIGATRRVSSKTRHSFARGSSHFCTISSMAMAASAYALSETSSHASTGDEPLEAAAFSASASAAAASRGSVSYTHLTLPTKA